MMGIPQKSPRSRTPEFSLPPIFWGLWAERKEIWFRRARRMSAYARRFFASGVALSDLTLMLLLPSVVPLGERKKII